MVIRHALFGQINFRLRDWVEFACLRMCKRFARDCSRLIDPSEETYAFSTCVAS